MVARDDWLRTPHHFLGSRNHDAPTSVCSERMPWNRIQLRRVSLRRRAVHICVRAESGIVAPLVCYRRWAGLGLRSQRGSQRPYLVRSDVRCATRARGRCDEDDRRDAASGCRVAVCAFRRRPSLVCGPMALAIYGFPAVI
eukprot:1469192-Prymnesium_polylepis.1